MSIRIGLLLYSASRSHAMRCPGEVWFLPPEAREQGDPKVRRHVLLTTCADEDDIGVFSYASTAAVEAAFGGATLLLDPSAHAYLHTGFSRPTYSPHAAWSPPAANICCG